uniref:Uncharacterized protein n=1 Tax=Anguilla anguilla TaxID=7936 RepID=A0A0E9W8V8_ANGAN
MKGTKHHTGIIKPKWREFYLNEFWKSPSAEHSVSKRIMLV